jgi:hypothetical protein
MDAISIVGCVAIMLFESSVTTLGKYHANIAALICFLLVFVFELLFRKWSFRDIVAFLVVLSLATFVWYLDVLRQWNCALWILTLKTVRDSIVPPNRRQSCGALCNILDAVSGLAGARALLMQRICMTKYKRVCVNKYK